MREPKTKLHYQNHVFFCVNQREDGKRCCADHDADASYNYVKNRMKEAGLHGPNMVRINRCGCLGRCAEGPVIVVYPKGIWYSYVDNEDLDEVIEQHLINGKIIQRLQI